MPTPVQHLVVAQEILASPTLPQAVRDRLEQRPDVRSAFFFGHIAPDVQVVSRQPRETTHFFKLPLTTRRPAYERMLDTHPSLTRPSELLATRAAFLAGYLAHLLLDEMWVREIFGPVFGPEQRWGEWRERLLLHNLLRAWLDRRAWPKLQADVGQLLFRARPNNWLPFVGPQALCNWRDLVAEQLAPGAAIRTVEIFANRARIPDAEFRALLESDVVEREIFCRISLAELDAFHQRAVVRSQDLIVRYLRSCAGSESE